MSIGNTHNKRLRQRGFTLIEVAASLLAFSVVVITFASTMVMAYKTAHVNGQHAQALSLCQHKMDQMRAMGMGRIIVYDELSDAQVIDATSTTSPYSFTDIDSVADYLPDPETSLTITSPCDDSDGVSNDGLAMVEITITWRAKAGDGKRSSVTIQGIVANT
ncbi:MAG: prepilin-type N-terminal cleavage/methylation domain-containing protein [Armatimonadota bacterium]|nr:prepilin-type N-terminal cleavage/methylation domain-containing protein [bacterium]